MDEDAAHQLLLPLVEDENICLPLPINVVSRYWNIELPMAEAIDSAKKYSDFNGSIMIEGIELAERHGLSCKIVHSSLNELKKIIAAVLRRRRWAERQFLDSGRSGSARVVTRSGGRHPFGSVAHATKLSRRSGQVVSRRNTRRPARYRCATRRVHDSNVESRTRRRDRLSHADRARCAGCGRHRPSSGFQPARSG